MHDLMKKLRGHDRRSIGGSNEVAKEIENDNRRFAEVFSGMLSCDPVVRMRAADAIEKATRSKPDLLQPYKRTILRRIAAIDQQEVRWHVALLLGRLRLSNRERDLAVAILMEFLEDKSSIVRTFAMQGLADLAHKDARLRKQVVPLIVALTENGTPAMRARGRKLLKNLQLE